MRQPRFAPGVTPRLLIIVGALLAPGIGVLVVLVALGKTPGRVGATLLAIWMVVLLVFVLRLEWHERPRG